MKPRIIERKLRDRFMRDLQKQRKIDNYEINITPILKLILQYDKYIKKNIYQDVLDP